MRLQALTFGGYGSGVTDFSALLAATAQPAHGELMDIVHIIANQVMNPAPDIFVSIIAVGHSDRQDRADFSCDQRRASEADAARDRAVSAWEWVKQQVTSVCAQSGFAAGDWWETSPHVTWGLVYSGAGMLLHNPPSAAQPPRRDAGEPFRPLIGRHGP